MNYTDCLAQLHHIFDQHGFAAHLAAGKTHACTIDIDQCASGTRITVCFPGYKAKQLNSRDYKVDLVRTGETPIPLSHSNIIVDIYNKCVYGGMNPANLRQALLHQAYNKPITKYDAVAAHLPYNPVHPSSELLDAAVAAHQGTGFGYSRRGNEKDLTIEELFKSIRWIALQEDMNYPMPGKKGRRMPYGRYLEILHVIEGADHTFDEVIARAVKRGFPPELWRDMDYSFEDKMYRASLI
jgi:hypothetical protein